MGRGKGSARRKPTKLVVPPEYAANIDATPQRLAKGDEYEFVNPAEIDSSEQPIGRTRRFGKLSQLDKWHVAQVITQRQFWAGHTYRVLHRGAFALPRVVSSYGERTTGGETDYGLARNAAQARARQKWRDARANISVRYLGSIDRLLLQNAL